MAHMAIDFKVGDKYSEDLEAMILCRSANLNSFSDTFDLVFVAAGIATEASKASECDSACQNKQLRPRNQFYIVRRPWTETILHP